MPSSGCRTHEQASTIGLVPDMEHVSLVHTVQKVAQPPAVEDKHPVPKHEAKYPATQALALEGHHFLHDEEVRQGVPDGFLREVSVVLRLQGLVDVRDGQEQRSTRLEQLPKTLQEVPAVLGRNVFEDFHQDRCIAGRKIVSFGDVESEKLDAFQVRVQCL